MDFESAIQDDRAVSPVIGVILMVAITVILAAVIGTFVIGLGNQTGSDTPRASFDVGVGNGATSVTFTHETGDTITSDNMVVKSTVPFDHANGGDEVTSATWTDIAGGATDVSAGSNVQITVDGATFSGETVRVVYNSPDSDSTTTLVKEEIS